MQEAFERLIQSQLDKAKAGEEAELGFVAEVQGSIVRKAEDDLRKAEKVQRGLQTSTLKRGYFDLGRNWEELRVLNSAYGTFGNRPRTTERSIRKNWQELHSRSASMELTLEERSDTLSALKEGMDLTESLDGLYRLYYVQIINTEIPMYKLRALLQETPKYTPAAEILMFAVTDLGNFGPDQRKDFYDHMYSQELVRASQVGLSTIGAPLAQYLAGI